MTHCTARSLVNLLHCPVCLLAWHSWHHLPSEWFISFRGLPTSEVLNALQKGLGYLHFQPSWYLLEQPCLFALPHGCPQSYPVCLPSVLGDLLCCTDFVHLPWSNSPLVQQCYITQSCTKARTSTENFVIILLNPKILTFATNFISQERACKSSLLECTWML